MTFFTLKLQMYSTADLPAQLNYPHLQSYRTETVTPKMYSRLTQEPIYVMLNYKILPYGRSKVLRTNRKTTLWDQAPPSRRLKHYSIRGLLITHCYSSCPGQHPLLEPLPRPWILLAILFQWIRFPLEIFFSLFLLFSLDESSKPVRGNISAKWNLLLVLNFNLPCVCSWRKNQASAPFSP